MHLVVRNHLADFQKKYDISNQESRQFEAFLNYVIFRTHCAGKIDPRELIYEGDDPGIDGVMVFIDDAYVSSVEEVGAVMNNRKRDADVTVVFTQAKTSEAWSKSEINVFESAVNDFLSGKTAYPQSDYMANAQEVFNAALRHVGKIRDGKPRVQAFFATTGMNSEDREILAAKSAIETMLAGTGYFSHIEVNLINRDSIVEMWAAAEGQVEATLNVLGSAAFPRTPGIDEGYVVTVRAKEFIDKILVDQNSRLRQRIFEDNVRDFLGSESEVNQEMADTLHDKDKQKRFGILNNGITMISPDVRVGGLEIAIRDFQIVNGCQTSNVLFENRDKIDDSVTIMLKLIETSDPAVIDDIVRATNRQAKVDEDQFLATLNAVKALERYFEARGTEDDLRLYFERRRNQFSHDDNVKAIRVFDIKEIARCVGAMFLDKPDVASRYPNRLTSEFSSQVFDPKYKEEIYHTAAYTLYRLKILIGNNRVERGNTKLRWHILMAIKYYVCGDSTPNLSSPKIKSRCKEIEDFMAKGDEETVLLIKGLCAAIVDVDGLTRDKLKGSSLTGEIKAKALEFRIAHPPTTVP